LRLPRKTHLPQMLRMRLSATAAKTTVFATMASAWRENRKT
jgi:hypothetical protein